MKRNLHFGALIIAAAALLHGACSDGEDGQPVGGDGNNGGTGLTASGAGGSAAGTGTGGLALDGGGLTGGGSGDDGCEKVDFLFIVDNSVSMSDQQAALIASFPGFMSTIQTTLSASSNYHIMVTDTDDWTRCTADNCTTGAMSADTLCIQAAGGYACNTALFTECDNIIGAGVVHPAGEGASNQPCTIYGDNRYIIEGEPDLTGTFSCMALVGLAGHPSERPMDSLVAAMSADMNGPAGCNEGFLRDDAILVITFISDDPNYEDSGTPQDWYDAVVAAKQGNPESVVVLGLTPAFEGCSNASKPDKGKHWSEFIALWGDQGLEASVCNLDYSVFFQQAVSVIDEACDEFEPPT